MQAVKVESSFDWKCPACSASQTETVTIDGPVMSLICDACTQDFGPNQLPVETRAAWNKAIDEVIPQ